MSPGPAEPAADEADIIVHRDLVYAERSDGPLRADLYRPRLGRYPDVVVVHPGGWVSGESPTSRN
jgi:acetyl esterase/lipase